MHAAEALVAGLDASVPYILADVVGCPERRCKVDKICSLPRDAGVSALHNASACIRSPAVQPCTLATLKAAADTCGDFAPSPHGPPFPCARNGALISRGMMHVLNVSRWRERCELANVKPASDTSRLRVYNCLGEAGYGITDPTHGDDPLSCVLGFLGPTALMATAKAVVAANGTCDAVCDHQLHKTVSVSMDDEASPEFVRELHASISAAKAASEARLARVLPVALEEDAAALAHQMRAARFVPDAGLLFTLTTANTHRWRLFINWLSHAVALRVPLLIFVSDARAAVACETALDAARAALNGPAAAPMLCFYAEATLGRFDMVPGADDWKDTFWRRVTGIAKPMSLALAASIGNDAVFAETDVVLRRDVLPLLRARPDTVTMTCARQTHNRSTFPLPNGNVGVVFLRADARLPPMLRNLAVQCGVHWETVNDQSALIVMMQAAALNASADPPFIFDCVDGSDGFTTGCSGGDHANAIAVHAACVSRTEDKVQWLRSHGIWIHPHEQPPPPLIPPPLPAPPPPLPVPLQRMPPPTPFQLPPELLNTATANATR